MKIKFTKPYTVQAAKGESYKEGQTVDLSDESAAHFLNRGVAEEVAPASRSSSDAGAEDAGGAGETPDFAAMTKDDLKSYADEHQIEGVTSSMAKDDMVKAVSKASRKGR